MSTTEDPKYLTVPEAADLLRTTPKAVYILFSRKQLPGAFKLGRRVLINQGTLLAALKNAEDEQR